MNKLKLNFIKLKNYLKPEQILKLLETCLLCLALLLITEIICRMPFITKYFGSGALEEKHGTLMWVILWLIMFAQVTIIPIPAMPILVFCNSVGIISSGNGILDLFSMQTLNFLIVTVSAAVAGSICSYWLGRLFGKTAIKWVAGDEQEYDKWCSILGGKVGSWVYAGTIILPLFPDDLLCIVAGAIKIKFKFYVIAHIVGQLIGEIAILIFMRLPFISKFFNISGDSNLSLIVYITLVILNILTLIIYRIHIKKKINS